MNARIDNSATMVMSNDKFVKDIFSKQPKPLLFWDTCALLNYIRFIFREDPGDITTYRAMETIYNRVLNDEIYSLAAQTTIVEWNEHVDDVISKNDLYLTDITKKYQNSIDVINVITSSSFNHEPINNKMLTEKLCKMVLEIINKTYFIQVDKDSAYYAHYRVVCKTVPANTKEEFKDCTIWEIMRSLYQKINRIDGTQKKCFYTVNTQDFCPANNFSMQLATEAATLKASLCKTILEVQSQLR